MYEECHLGVNFTTDMIILPNVLFRILQKLHAAGKTEEARADLARLAIIRKQREDAAKKREEEQKGGYNIIGVFLIGVKRGYQ